ncbi:MAG: TolC family protein [Alistipes sp.]|nr:TolC family protein [Alistipes sp.]
MSKFSRLIVLLCAMLSGYCVLAADRVERVLTLEEIYTLADQHSKSIKSGEVALQEADVAVREAKSKHLPNIDLSVMASYLGDGLLTDRNFANAMNVDMPHFGNNFAVEASQLIYGGGAVSSGVAMAKLQQEMASVGLAESRTRVRFMLTAFYLDLYKLHNLLKVYDRNIELAETLIENTRAREEQGVALANDITRYELRLQNISLARRKIANGIEILNANMVEMLSLEPQTYIIPDERLVSLSMAPRSEAYWQGEATSHSYNLRRSALGVRMSEQGVKLARANMLPNLSVVAANHFDGPITIEVPVINKNFNYWFVGLRLSWSLSSLYKANQGVKRAKYATLLAQSRYDEAKEGVTLAVKSDYIKYLESFDELVSYRKSLQLAQENYGVVETRYKNDMAIATDMVDAANELLNAELQLSNSQMDVIFKYYKLKSTTGNL